MLAISWTFFRNPRSTISREFKEMLEVCISFCNVSDKNGAFQLLPCSHENAVAHILGPCHQSTRAGPPDHSNMNKLKGKEEGKLRIL